MPDPTDFDLDTALSADLDGELASYCSDLGLPVETVRTTLAAPGARARRAELEAIRTALMPAVRPDELTRRRLLAGAVTTDAATTGERTGRRQLWLTLGAAAAAAILLVAVIVVASRGGDSATKSGATAARQAPHGDLGNIGALSQQQIDDLIRGRRPSGSRSSEAAPFGAQSAPAAGPTTSGADLRQPDAPGFTPSAAAASPAQIHECATQYANQGSVRFQASGMFQGRSAIILGIDTDRRTIVFVVAADNCGDVLYSASR